MQTSEQQFDWLKIILPLVMGIIGYLSAVLVERRRDSVAKKNLLRNAYADWFTSARLARTQVSELIPLAGVRGDAATTASLVTKTKEFADKIKLLLRSSHEIYFIERNTARRKLVSQVTELLARLHDLVVSDLYVQTSFLGVKKGADDNWTELLRQKKEIALNRESINRLLAKNDFHTDDPQKKKLDLRISSLVEEIAKTEADHERDINQSEKTRKQIADRIRKGTQNDRIEYENLSKAFDEAFKLIEDLREQVARSL